MFPPQLLDPARPGLLIQETRDLNWLNFKLNQKKHWSSETQIILTSF
jgi:hypothetical protein